MAPNAPATTRPMQSRVTPSIDHRQRDLAAVGDLLDDRLRHMLDRAVDQDEIIGRAAFGQPLGQRPLDQGQRRSPPAHRRAKAARPASSSSATTDPASRASTAAE